MLRLSGFIYIEIEYAKNGQMRIFKAFKENPKTIRYIKPNSSIKWKGGMAVFTNTERIPPPHTTSASRRAYQLAA